MASDLDARIKVGADTRDAEAGIDRVNSKVASMGDSASKAGERAGAAFDGMGKSSEEAAAKFTRSEARMVSGLRSTVEQMEVALRQSQGLADAFQFKAEFRGFDAAKFNPMLERVRELESQLSLVKAAEAEWAAQNAFAQKSQQAAQLAKASEYTNWWATELKKAEAAEVELAAQNAFAKKHQQATELAKASQYASWWAAELDKVEAAERKLASETNFIKSLQSQSDAIGKTRADLLEMQAAQMGLSAQAAPYIANLRQAEKGMQGVGMSAKAMDAAMRGVPAQISDIVVSLQGGMPVMTVFLQQGLQLRDMFGGFGEAGKALGSTVLSMVSPLTIAGAAVAALGLAYYQGSKEQDAFVKAIVLTGNASGMTTSQLHEYARQIDAVVGTQAQAAAGLAAFTAAGVQGGDELRRYTQTAIEWERATGQAVEKTAEQFASLQKDPLAAVLKLNEGTNFLTTSVYEQIKALEEQGKKTEAAEVAMNALDATMRERAKAIEESLGYIERSWRFIKEEALGAWDAMLGVGRKQTNRDLLTQAQEQLRIRQEKTPLVGDDEAWQKGNEKIAARIHALTDLINAEDVHALSQSESAKQTQSLIDFDKKWAKALEEKKTLTQKLTEAEAEARANNKSDADVKRILAFVTEEHNKGIKKAKDGTKAYNKELSDQKKLIGELSGLASTFYKDWERLNKMYAQGRLSLSELEKEQSKLLAKQPFAVALAKEEEEATKARVKAYEEEVKAQDKLLQQRQDAAQKAQEAVQKARDEEEAYAYAAAAGITLAEAVAHIALARAEENYQKGLAQNLDGQTLLALQQERDARRELIEVMAQKGTREANKKAQDQITKDWEKLSQTVGRTLADYIMGGGKDAAQYLKRLFATLVLEPVVQYGAQSLMGGLGGAGASGGGLGSSGMPGGSLTDWSSWGSKGSFWMMDQGMSLVTDGWNSTGSALMSLGQTVQSVDLWLKDIPGFSGGIGSAAGYLGSIYSLTQGNYGAAIGSAIGTYILPGVGTMIGSTLGGLLDGLDDSGTPHMGGSAMWSAATGGKTNLDLLNTSKTDNPLSNIDNQFGSGFGWVEDRAEVRDVLGVLAQGMGSSLDSFAKSFGSAFGYEVALGFADDTSKDGSWGALRIALGGQDVVNWNDNRESKWAPRSFSDGEEGYKQYLSAVFLDVKTALLGMDLPAWADQILDASSDIDTINAALQQIGATRLIFDQLGQRMQMFSGISGDLQTQLLMASGGIESLSANAGTFYQGFFDESERMEALNQQLRDALSGLDLSIDPAMGEAAKRQYRAAVEAAMAGGQGELVAQLLAMSGTFATAADAAQKSMSDMAAAAEELSQNLRSSLTSLEAQFSGGGFARQYQAEDAAKTVQQLLGDVGISKDLGVLTQTLLSATSADVESYFREIWNVLDTDAARQKLVDVTGVMLDLAEASGSAADKAQALGERITSALTAMNSAGSLLDRIDGALGGSGDGYSLLREQRLWSAMAEADYKTQIDLAGQLTDSVLSRYQMEQQAAQKQIDFARSLRSYVDSLTLGNLSPLTTGEKLAEAARQYQQTLSKAQAGDEQAMGALQGISSSYLDLARQYYASSDAYTQIFGNVTGSLDALGIQSQTDAQQQLAVSSQSLDQLRTLQGVLEGAYSQAEADYAVQRDLLQSQIDYAAQTATGIDVMVQLLAGLPAEIGLRMAGSAGDGSYAALAQQWVGLMQPYGLTKSATQVAGELSSMSAADLQRNYEIGAGLLGNGAQRDEWDALIAKLRGGLIDGSHAGGLDYVPFDGYIAQLHRGERVQTAAEARAYQAPAWASYGAGDGVQALVAEVKALRAEVAQLRSENREDSQMQVRAAVESNRENAAEIVRGVGQSTERAAYAQSLNKGAEYK